jgi:metallo-beta-lactamase class B
MKFWTLFLTPFLVATGLGQTPTPAPIMGSEPVEPYKVIGNIYYVGATDVSSHIIVTPEGLILLDTGTAQMLPGIRRNVEKLGYNLRDIKVILSSHAHWDHVEGHAAMKELTGAQVMALGEDAAAITSGLDSSAAGAKGWKPVKVDRVLKDGDTVALGGITLQAHLTPGHTKGCTTWSTTVQEEGKSYVVVFLGGTGINQGVKLLGNTRHPGIVDDYARTFRVLKGLRPDVFLAQHPSMYQMAEKMQRLQAGGAQNPFIDPEGYQRFVNEEERKYLKQLAAEKSTQQ